MKIVVPSSPMNRVDLYKDAGFEVVEARIKTEEDMIEFMQDADGAQVNTLPLTTRRVLESCPKLKVISRFGVGVDSIDLDAATELGILACNVPGVNTTEVADHAVAMLLALTRRMVDAVNTTREGAWRDNPRLNAQYYTTARRIAGHTVGVIGFGNIGRAFATRMRGFGPSRIVAYDPYVDQLAADLYGVQMVSLEELLGEADYISIHTSSTDETRHIINADTLKLMKSTAIIVNTSRGPMIDGEALAKALEDGQIEAAGLDVSEVEPIPSESPLLKLPNCIVTPHFAGFSPTFLEECAIHQAENIIFGLTGKKPHGIANPEAIKTIAVMRATNPGRWEGIPDFSTALQL